MSDITQETDTIKTFSFTSRHGEIPFDFLPGQYVDLELEIDGVGVHRSYSISSSASQKRYIDITVKREPDGLVSRYLWDRVKVGDKLNIRGPFGQFTFNERKARRVVLVGAGVGVTPLVSIIRSLKDKDWNGEIYALFGFRREADSLFLDELTEMQESFPQLHLYTTWSAPESRQTKPRGRLTAKAVRKFARKLKDTDIFICGPTAMMDELQTGLTKAGVPKRNLRVEAFAPPPKDLSKGGEFDIAFRPAGKTITSQPGESILETAERAGVEIDYSCRSGTCGLCQAKLIAGEVDLAIDDALEEEEIEGGIVLTCQSFPRLNCTIQT